MMNTILSYLLESSICLVIFATTYQLLISKLTHFLWIRFYLIISVVLSLVLPFIILPVHWDSTLLSSDAFGNSFMFQINQPDIFAGNKANMNNLQQSGGIDNQLIIFYFLMIVYSAGFVYKAFGFIRNLLIISKCISQNSKIKEGNYWIVNLKSEMPAFSFFNYIFINQGFKNLSPNDIQLIKDHETIHANQFHTLDILFVELVSIVFWFNPLMKYLKKSLQEVHEYIVDEQIAVNTENKKSYAQLLLNLASENKAFSLSAGFTGHQIKRRILTLTKPRSLPVNKLRFAVIMPIVAFLLLSFSYIKNPKSNMELKQQNDKKITSYMKIGNIIWKGNTVYSIDTLNIVFGLKKGDDYDYNDVKRRLTEDNISTLYYDNGYVFYKTDFFENQKNNGEVDLNIEIFEGPWAKIGEITIKGNKNVSSEEILEKIQTHTGDLFTKTKIVNSVKAISAMGKFEQDKVIPVINPNKEKSKGEEFWIVDIVFEVTEINQK